MIGKFATWIDNMVFRALLISLLLVSQADAQSPAPTVATTTLPAKKDKWASATTTPGDLFHLLTSGNMDQILATETEIGFTRRRLGDGRYLQQHWAVALATFAKEHNGPAEMISSRWLEDKGMNSYACPLRASVLYNQAVIARGGGYADTVTDAMKATIQLKLDEADKVLGECGKRLQETLFWQILRLRVTFWNNRLEHLEKPHFDAAIQLWPDADEIYEPALFEALPVWGGSVEELEQIIDDATERTRDRLKTVMYARLYQNILSQQIQLQLSDTKAEWGKLKQSMADFRMLKEPDLDGYMRYLGFACAQEDYAEARLLLDSIQKRYGHPDVSERAQESVFGTIKLYEADPCFIKARALPQ